MMKKYRVTIKQAGPDYDSTTGDGQIIAWRGTVEARNKREARSKGLNISGIRSEHTSVRADIIPDVIHDPDILTIHEAAEYLRMHYETLRKMAADGEVPRKKLANKWVFSREQLKRWVEGKI